MQEEELTVAEIDALLAGMVGEYGEGLTVEMLDDMIARGEYDEKQANRPEWMKTVDDWTSPISALTHGMTNMASLGAGHAYSDEEKFRGQDLREEHPYLTLTGGLVGGIKTISGLAGKGLIASSHSPRVAKLLKKAMGAGKLEKGARVTAANYAATIGTGALDGAAISAIMAAADGLDVADSAKFGAKFTAALSALPLPLKTAFTAIAERRIGQTLFDKAGKLLTTPNMATGVPAWLRNIYRNYVAVAIGGKQIAKDSTTVFNKTEAAHIKKVAQGEAKYKATLDDFKGTQAEKTEQLIKARNAEDLGRIRPLKEAKAKQAQIFKDRERILADEGKARVLASQTETAAKVTEIGEIGAGLGAKHVDELMVASTPRLGTPRPPTHEGVAKLKSDWNKEFDDIFSKESAGISNAAGIEKEIKFLSTELGVGEKPVMQALITDLNSFKMQVNGAKSFDDVIRQAKSVAGSESGSNVLKQALNKVETVFRHQGIKPQTKKLLDAVDLKYRDFKVINQASKNAGENPGTVITPKNVADAIKTVGKGQYSTGGAPHQARSRTYRETVTEPFKKEVLALETQGADDIARLNAETVKKTRALADVKADANTKFSIQQSEQAKVLNQARSAQDRALLEVAKAEEQAVVARAKQAMDEGVAPSAANLKTAKANRPINDPTPAQQYAGTAALGAPAALLFGTGAGVSTGGAGAVPAALLSTIPLGSITARTLASKPIQRFIAGQTNPQRALANKLRMYDKQKVAPQPFGKFGKFREDPVGQNMSKQLMQGNRLRDVLLPLGGRPRESEEEKRLRLNQ